MILKDRQIDQLSMEIAEHESIQMNQEVEDQKLTSLLNIQPKNVKDIRQLRSMYESL